MSELLLEVEGDAVALLAEGGYDRDSYPAPGKLIYQFLHTFPQPDRIPGRAELRFEDGLYRIKYNAGLRCELVRFVVLHELAHWWYASHDYVGQDIESRCNMLAAALLVPRHVLIKARHELGPSVIRIAKALRVPQALVLARVGEVFDVPVVVQTKKHVMVRGAEWGWPYTEAELRWLVKNGAGQAVQVRITDDSDSAGLMAVQS